MKVIIFICLLIILVIQSVGYVQANNKLDSLLFELKKEGVDSIRMQHYYSIAKIYRNLNLAKSIAYADSSVELAFLLKDSMLYAESLFLSGTCYSEMGLYKNALDRLKRAYDIFLLFNNSIKALEVKINIGNVFWFETDYLMALNLYKEALILSKNNSNHKEFALNMNIALCYSNLNFSDSTFEVFDRMKNKIDTLGEYGKALSFMNIGSVYLKHGQLDSANYYLQKSQKHQQGLSKTVLLFLKASQAQVNSRLGHASLANKYFDSCKTLAQEEASYLGLKEYYLTKFEIDTTLKRYKDAVESHQKLMQINDTLFQKDQIQLLANYKVFYNLNLKEKEIEALKKDNELIKIKSMRNKMLILALVLIVGLIAFLALVFIRLNRLKLVSIIELNELNAKLSKKQKQLSNQNTALENTLTELKETQSQLLQSEKLASIGILAAGIAHEINNPLNYINGGVVLLEAIEKEFSEKDAFYQQYINSLQMIKEGVVKTNNVVKALGSYAFKVDTEHALIDINEAIEAAYSSVQFKLKSDINVFLTLGDVGLISADIEKVNTVFIQLLLNAIDAVKTCKIKNEKSIRIKSENKISKNVKTVEVSIANTGENLDKELQNRLFDPFFTTKDPDKGYGLGLSIAYNLVKELKGEIMVNNMEDGVEFVVKFPAN